MKEFSINNTIYTGLKMWIFDDFCVLNLIGTFIWRCELAKTAKMASKFKIPTPNGTFRFTLKVAYI